MLFKSILLSTLNVKLNRLHSVHTQLKMGTYMYLYIAEIWLRRTEETQRLLLWASQKREYKTSWPGKESNGWLFQEFILLTLYKYNMMSSSFCDVTLWQGREKIVISLVNYPTPISTISPQQTSFTDVIG